MQVVVEYGAAGRPRRWRNGRPYQLGAAGNPVRGSWADSSMRTPHPATGGQRLPRWWKSQRTLREPWMLQ